MPSLAQAIEMMAIALQQQSATVAHEHQAVLHQLENARLPAEATQLHHQHHTLSLEDFLRHDPPKFNWGENPDKADQWMRDIERIFEATQCPKERKLSYVEYMLTNDVEFWWIGMGQIVATGITMGTTNKNNMFQNKIVATMVYYGKLWKNQGKEIIFD